MATSREKFRAATRSAQVGTVLDFSGDEIKFVTISAPITFTIINPILGHGMILEIDGIFAVTLPATITVVNGDYCPDLGINWLFIWCVDAVTPLYLGSWTTEI